jgi:peptidoglycan hydrolase-like protein with peptidoglycan-binding domain
MPNNERWKSWVHRGELGDRILRRGDNGPFVELIQEWLTLAGHGLKVDGEFGPATEAALRAYERLSGLPVTGTAGKTLLDHLERPMARALMPLAPQGRGVAALTLAYARQHLAAKAREVGGQNRGPWARLYMQGRQGAQWPWCAGFACFCLQQACETLEEALPLEPSFSCDSLAASARERGLFLAEPAPPERARVRPGSLFLSRRSPGDWAHVGIVEEVAAEHFRTVEGNTNDEGSREGYEVAARFRGYAAMDFALLP